MSDIARYYVLTGSQLPAARLSFTAQAPWVAVAVRGIDVNGNPLRKLGFRFRQGQGELDWEAECCYEMVFSTAPIDQSVITEHNLQQPRQSARPGGGIEFASASVQPGAPSLGRRAANPPPPPPPSAPTDAFVIGG